MATTAHSYFTMPAGVASQHTEAQPKMLFIATHPRSTSTALERAFLTRSKHDTICVHEPFGDAFYFGPERMSTRFSDKECNDSPYSHTTYRSVVEDIQAAVRQAGELTKEKDGVEPVIVIKDMAQYIIPPEKEEWYARDNVHTNTCEAGNVTTAPSFGAAAAAAAASQSKASAARGADKNPTVVPTTVLSPMTFVFLLRSPHLAVPSYYRCCIPPLSERTGFDHFRSSEVGIRELRILYEHLQATAPAGSELLVIDSEDLCREPEPVIRRVCEKSGIPYDPSMLEWKENNKEEIDMFAKWKGFHDDALNSKGFGHNRGSPTGGSVSTSTDFSVDFPAWEQAWAAKYSPEQVKEIRQAVEEHLPDYLYMRQFKTVF